MAYDPYKAAEQIVRNKGRWSTAVATGKSGDEYHEKAKYYYAELRENGYSGIADKLEGYGYGEALEYLDTLDKNGGTYDADKALASAEANRESLDNKRTELYDRLMNEYKTVYSDAEDGKLSEEGERIYAEFKEAGERATGHTVAEVAASNSGNVDSYAAANAHRQMTDYLKAGSEAASKAENERTDRLLSVLDGIYSTGKGLLDSEGASIDDAESTAYAVYKADQERAIADGEWEKITSDDYYGDRYEKYLSTLVKLYPDYADEISDIFHFLG
ncbi:MAG: hypothetical protein II370_00040 [Clostridia bacterium]|nr:hypothetical protein [Clostridia bacterium]